MLDATDFTELPPVDRCDFFAERAERVDRARQDPPVHPDFFFDFFAHGVMQLLVLRDAYIHVWLPREALLFPDFPSSAGVTEIDGATHPAGVRHT